MKTLLARRLKDVETEIKKSHLASKVLWHNMETGKTKREKGLKKWRKSCKEQAQLIHEKAFLEELLKSK